MISVGGKEFRTLADRFYVNGQQVQEAYVNGEKVYPEDDQYVCMLTGHTESNTDTGPFVGSMSITWYLTIMSKQPMKVEQSTGGGITLFVKGPNGRRMDHPHSGCPSECDYDYHASVMVVVNGNLKVRNSDYKVEQAVRTLLNRINAGMVIDLGAYESHTYANGGIIVYPDGTQTHTFEQTVFDYRALRAYGADIDLEPKLQEINSSYTPLNGWVEVRGFDMTTPAPYQYFNRIYPSNRISLCAAWMQNENTRVTYRNFDDDGNIIEQAV